MAPFRLSTIVVLPTGRRPVAAGAAARRPKAAAQAVGSGTSAPTPPLPLPQRGSGGTGKDRNGRITFVRRRRVSNFFFVLSLLLCAAVCAAWALSERRWRLEVMRGSGTTATTLLEF